MSPRRKGALLLTLAFALGVVAGAASVGLLGWRGGWHDAVGPRVPRLAWLERELALSAAQRREVEVILRETGQEFARLREEVGPRFREIRLRSRARIRELLDPAQREKFDTLAARRDQGAPAGRPGAPGPPRGR